MPLCSHLTRQRANALYQRVLAKGDYAIMRELAKGDLFFLLTVVLNRQDAQHDWIYARCREVEASPDGHLDLWPRYHYKSTIITFALTIQDILKDPNVTVAIFSFNGKIARGFLSQIKRELETNDLLKALFPEVLYANPASESPCWCEQKGLIVKRTANPKECTVEAHGLTDGQPTSRHFKIRVYDDMVTMDSVNTPEQIEKTTRAWEMSQNLSSGEDGIERIAGTRYHLYDTYRAIMDRGAASPRVYVATTDGTIDGPGVYLSRKSLDEKLKKEGPYVFGSQMLQNPVADKAMSFLADWIVKCVFTPQRTWNRYILCDPANAKKKRSDFTTMLVIGLAPDFNYYLLDGFRCRYNLRERTAALFKLHRKWQPNATAYEQYGKDSDIQHIEEVQERENYRFPITATSSSAAKEDRIRELIPIYSEQRFKWPTQLMYLDHENRWQNLIVQLEVDEFMSFPVCQHDDILDAMQFILRPEVGAVFPRLTEAFDALSSHRPAVLAEYDYFA